MWRLLDIHVEVSGQSEGRGQDLLQQLTHAHDRISKASSLDDIRAARAVMEQELVHARRTLAEKAKDDRDRAQRLARQVSRLDEELSSVRGQADYDVLTQLLHQRAFMHQLRRAMEGGKVCSLAYLDLDDFKTINDALGHLVGDRLLAFVAGQLRGLGRSVDILSRHAADEFCFAAPGYSAEQLSQRLAPLASRRDVQLELDDRVCSALLSVSIGIAQSGPLETAESLMRRAEWALAAAKRHGRSTIRLAPPSAGPNHEGHG
jgi:diguanylate cyclase (GGDEF)-like protein